MEQVVSCKEGTDEHWCPKISFCIPTYNRAYALKGCLQSIIEQPGFKKYAQIVVSDNASNDDTEAIVTYYKEKYPENIVYHKNAKNIGMEQNFKVALDLGTGKLLKLLNDYTVLKPNVLCSVIDLIEKNKEEDFILFFNNAKIDGSRKHDNLDSFFRSITYRITWIGTFSIWKSDYKKIVNKEQYFGQLFFHVNVFLKTTEFKKNFLIITTQLFDRVNIKSGGGYGFYKIFINNFLGEIIYPLNLKRQTVRTIKTKHLRNLVVPQTITILCKKEGNLNFNLKGFHFLLKHYWYYPHFYLYTAYTLAKFIVCRTKSIVR